MTKTRSYPGMDPLARTLLIIFLLVAVVLPGLILLALLSAEEPQAKEPPCMELPEDKVVWNPPGVYEFEATIPIHNCGSRTWEQGEYRLYIVEGDATIFFSPINIPKTRGGKDADVHFTFELPSLGRSYTGIYLVRGPDGSNVGHPFPVVVNAR
jgi:hypothetical protein